VKLSAFLQVLELQAVSARFLLAPVAGVITGQGLTKSTRWVAIFLLVLFGSYDLLLGINVWLGNQVYTALAGLGFSQVCKWM